MFDPLAAPPSQQRMFKLFLKLAIPAILTNLSQMTTLIVSYIFAGQMTDSLQLAALGLAFSCNSIMVLWFLIGMNSAQETLTSQAFGANDFQLVGVYLNRGFLILIAFFIPLAIIPGIFAERIFLGLGQDEEVSHIAADLLRLMLPSSFFFG